MILGVSLLAIFLLGLTAWAYPVYLQLFKRVEKPPPKSQLDKAKCLTCHVKASGGKGLNPYGIDFEKYGKNEESLKKIRPLDSDSDGVINSSEIAAGTLPGDAKSKPPEKKE